MGKAARRRRREASTQGRQRAPVAAAADGDPRKLAEAALSRLVRTNAPGRLSIAGAYAFGYGGLGIAHQEGDAPDWYDDLDPLDALFLGTAWPYRFRDAYEFGNAQTAWLRLMRTTRHWAGIERLAHEVVEASEEHELPVDDGELMLLVAGRLEDAGLDQRKLPAALLPGAALANARFIVAPDPDLVLPSPPPDATERVTGFWASTEVELAHDGTAVDALREGLHMLGKLGLNVREDTIVLLPALYAALVAADDERLDQAGERAEAWALGLPDESPLAPVVDVMITAARRDLAVDATLGHLFGLPTFAAQIPAADRQFTSEPGTALIQLAFELGHRQVVTREHKTLRLDEGTRAMFEAQLRAFEEKFGRPPGPDDPIFFDPNADEPRPMQLADVEAHTTAVLEAAGISGAWIYAHQHTQGLLPRPDGSFNSDADRREWDEAIERYLRTHPDEVVDDDEQVGRLRMALAVMSVSRAGTDPDLGASLVQRLSTDDDRDDEADVVADYLHGSAPMLAARLSDPDVARAAAELARAWSGSALAARVRAAASARPSAAGTDLPVLLAAAAATITNPAARADPAEAPSDGIGIDLEAVDVCEQLVSAILESGEPDVPKGVFTSVLEFDHEDMDRLVTLLTARAVGYLVSMRESGVTVGQLEAGVTWLANNFGADYAGPAGVAASLAGHPDAEAYLSKQTGVREVTFAHLAEFLDIEFFPAMIWLCTAMVATSGDGNVDWLRRHRVGGS